MSVVEIYTDGACRGNPGPGGWAALLSFGEREKELAGAEAMTTNNRMELTAVIRALEALKRPVQARVYTDSEYVRRGITEWLHAWKARGWRTADRKPVKNQDLWERLDELAADMKAFPQKLVNVRVREKKTLADLPSVVQEIRECEAALDGSGRILVRFSGTEPLARVMVEASDPRQVEE